MTELDLISASFGIRERGSEGIGRAFFRTMVGRRIEILHGFIKKTRETPAEELKTARRRMQEIQRGQ